MAITWITDSVPTGAWYAAAIDPVSGRILVAADDGSTIYSDDQGATWTAGASVGFAVYSMTFGNGVFLATQNGGTGAATSADGESWTASAMPASRNWSQALWVEDLGLFLVPAYGSDKLATSATGLTGSWTERTLPSSAGWNALAWNGTHVLVVSSGGSTAAARSTDGTTYVAATLPVSGDWQQVCWSQALALFVIVGYGTDVALVSATGDTGTYTSTTLPSNTDWYTVAPFGDEVIAITDYDGNDTALFNGTTWTADTDADAGAATGWYAYAYTDALFVAVSYDTDVVITQLFSLPEFLVDNASALEQLVLPTPFRRLSDTATAAELLVSLVAGGLADTARASDVAHAYASLLATLTDEAEAHEELLAMLLGVLESTAYGDDQLIDFYTMVGELIDRALAADPLLTNIQASNLLFATAVASELLGVGAGTMSLSDNAEATDTLVTVMNAVAALLSEAVGDIQAIDYLSVIGFLSDDADATFTSAQVAQRLVALLESGAAAAIVLSIGGAQFTAWVLNTENVAVTQYTNYPFNSYAELNGRYYGAASDGIYLLEGADDAGTPIQAYLRAPLTDFGFAGLKRLEQPTLGYTSDGELVFKAVVVSPNGTKEEHWYRLEARPTGGTRENRAKIGKGLKSVYWQFELHNINGSDFQIETIRLWPMGLTRKVR